MTQPKRLSERHIGNLSKAFPEIAHHFDFRGEAILRLHKDDVTFIGRDRNGKFREIIVLKNGWILHNEFRGPDTSDLFQVEKALSEQDISPFVLLSETVDKLIEANAVRFIQHALEIFEAI